MELRYWLRFPVPIQKQILKVFSIRKNEVPIPLGIGKNTFLLMERKPIPFRSSYLFVNLIPNSSETNKMLNIERRREIVFSSAIEMPTPLRNRIAEIGGYDIQIVIQKQLKDTDVNKNQGRLCIPIKKLMTDFATEEEKKLLGQCAEDDKKKNGLKVTIIDPVLRESLIGLKLWKIGSHETYCLVTEWNSFVQQNSLESGDYIQLWSFRTDFNNLYLALVKLDISEGIFKFI